MASLTYVEAQAEVFGRLEAAWTADGAVTEDLPIIWPDKGDKGPNAPKPPSNGSSYAEVELHFGDNRDAAMGDQQRKYKCDGVLILNLYTPHGAPLIGGMRLSLQASQLFADAMSGPSARGLMFRGTSTTDMGKYGIYSRTRMTAGFDFYQVR